MPITPRTAGLPERASLEQLRKQAKDLRRDALSQVPTALALVARYAPPSRAGAAGLTLDTAQSVVARHYGFSSWARLRRHLDARARTPTDPERRKIRTTEDFYRLRSGWAAAEDVRRCAAVANSLHPDPSEWLPLFTARHNGVTVIAFDSPAGALFAELTPVCVTLAPTPVGATAGRGPSVTFRTGLGTFAGVVPPNRGRLVLERRGQPHVNGHALVTGGLFVAPNAFRADVTGVLLRGDGAQEAVTVPLASLPPQTDPTVDRHVPAAEGSSDLRSALRAADAPPVLDPEQWRPGVRADLTATERVRLGRYGTLLVWHTTHEDDGEGAPYVVDFTPQPGPVRDLTLTGRHLAATHVHYGFTGGVSTTPAVVGLVDDVRVAGVVLRREGRVDLPARIAGGTFLIAGPDLAGFTGRGPGALVARDHEGRVSEVLAYGEAPSSRP